MKAKILLIALILSASSCGSVSEAYVLADRLTYEAVATEYRAYVEADPRLDRQAIDRRLRTLDSWRRRLESASAAARPSLPPSR